MIDEAGENVSLYGDSIWRLDPWAGKPMRLNFGDGPDGSSSGQIDSFNANLLRLVTAFWTWGPSAAYSCRTLKAKFHSIRRVFVFCSQQGIQRLS
ncbi:hypothetical protein LP415_18270 [Polaromonas sp. P1(28)-8]|nr:hypothetical protein LP415_18270 [Polaromonas sp. P1(28)-8]